MRILPVLVFCAILSACGDEGGGTEPEPSKPANIVVVSASSAMRFNVERVTVAMKNDGGDGAFKLQMWGLPSSPHIFTPGSPPPANDGYTRSFGETEGVSVKAGWSETGSYDVPTGSSSLSVRRITVLSRDEGSINWRETHRYDIPR